MLLILPQRNIRYDGFEQRNIQVLPWPLLLFFSVVLEWWVECYFSKISLWSLYGFLQVVYLDGDVEVLLLKNEQYKLIEGDAVEDEVRRHTDFALLVNCHVPCMLVESQDNSMLIKTFKYIKSQL